MKYILFTVFAGVTLWLTLNVHSRSGYFGYKSEIFSDKAGYYVYLPAAFIYHFDGDMVADTLPVATGEGFHVDAQGKISTKYPMGVACMEAPFFLATHWIVAPLLGYPADGFSPPYHKMVDVAAWVYLLLAMLLLYRVLTAYFSPRLTYFILFATYLGTNLFYYAAVESGMSHIYSFFLVAALLRLTQLVHQRGAVSLRLGLTIGLVAGLLFVTRFTNLFALSLLLFWEVSNWTAFKARLQTLFRPKALLAMLVAPVILIGIQMGYYVYLSGSPFHYPYEGEGFDFAHSQFIKVWFSPQNGLFLYAPMVLFALLGCIFMLRSRRGEALYLLGMFAMISFVFGAWWQWYFGCAYGARSFVEYIPLLTVGLGYFMQWAASKPLPWRALTWTVMGLLCIVCFKNGYIYKLCFLGVGEWDFEYWWRMTLAVKP